MEQHGKHKKYWIQEYCYTGSLAQRERTRRMADYVVYALSHGIDRIRWYANHFVVDGVRGSLPGCGVVYGVNGMLKGQGEKLSASMTVLPQLVEKENYPYIKGNFFPFLQWCMYYQLQQHFGIEEPRKIIEWGQDIKGALFDGTDYSTAAVWGKSRSQAQHMLLETGDVPFTLTDMYGRKRKIIPVGGKALLTVSEDPLLFKFDKKVAVLKAKQSKLRIVKSSDIITAGGEVNVTLELKNETDIPFAADVIITIDDSWKIEPARQSVALKPGETAKVDFKLKAPLNISSGKFPFMVNIANSAGNIGWLKDSLTVSPKLDVAIASVPYSRHNDPAITVKMRNNSAKTVSGLLSLDGGLGAGKRPAELNKKMSIPAQQVKTVKFPLKGWVPNMNRDYEVKALFTGSAGDKANSSSFLSFRAVSRLKTKVRIDGDIKDWGLAELVPFDFYRAHSRAGASWTGFDFKKDKMTWHGDEDASGRFYVQWDDDNLYFLFIFRDDIHWPGGKGVGIWSYDALHFQLYPFAVQPGKSIKGTNYKDHIGMDKNGKAVYDRCQGTVGNWTIGSGRPDGVKIAVKRSGKDVIPK